MEFAGHEAILRKTYGSHWLPNIDLTLHKITAKRLIDRWIFILFFLYEKNVFYREIHPFYINVRNSHIFKVEV